MDNDSAGRNPTRHLRMAKPSRAASLAAAVPLDRGPEAEVADRLQDLVLASPDLEDFLTGLAGFSAALAAGGPRTELACSVSVKQRRRTLLQGGSTAAARTLAEIQSRRGAGPVMAALEQCRSVLVANIAEDSRWPECSASFLEVGLNSVLAVPLVLDQGDGAVFGFYSAERDVFTEVVVRGAERYAHDARKALMLAVRIAANAQRAQDLEDAMKSRTAIDLAVGIIMGQQRCSQDDAFAILSKAASNRNQKLRAVATELVENLAGTGVKTHFEN